MNFIFLLPWYVYLIYSKLFDAAGIRKTSTLDIATTNSISIMGFNFEVLVYLEGLLKSIKSYKIIKANRNYFGWIFSILYICMVKRDEL